ncbi:MAG TPA: sigma-70 family RNA polymerase sigma factor [Gemmatimonadaceae bacterium]|jgi:RNA polymerase sigma factor (sigma-70 family)
MPSALARSGFASHVGQLKSNDGPFVPEPMTPELSRLLDARTETACDEAWTEFIRVHHRLLVHVARSGRSAPHNDDTAMDAYAFILDRLRESGFRRLRAFAADGRSTFVTWLVVVARRLRVDFARSRYGRVDRRDADDATTQEQLRRRLVDLAGAEMDLAAIPDPSESTPETIFDAASVRQALHEAIIELEPRERLLLTLRFEDDLTAERIASTLAMPSSFHVYRQLNRILAKLRKRLHYLKEGNPAA